MYLLLSNHIRTTSLTYEVLRRAREECGREIDPIERYIIEVLVFLFA